ncbi:MAG: carboxylesterase/lipase family protein [Acidimicrobiia bacterium]|nr:carboxylesterase/lipase family protein [Acidimicrobiia bacterium]
MGPIVDTPAGRLEGRERRGVLLFAGIPYATSTAGDARFRLPEAHPGWSGVRDASTFGKVAPQHAGPLEMIAGGGAPDWSEDCLSLNVVTPSLDGPPRPVMVWIHGGGFTGGSGSIPWYDGTKLALRGDVVVVTINYRLGAFGWLHLGHLDPDLADSGCAGLADQVEALRWVARSIEAFGGDPEQVTIFGESAGGMSVATLMGTPSAAGLFSKAIAQSGAAHNTWDGDAAAEVTNAVMAAAGVRDVAGLRKLDPDALLEAQTSAATSVTRDRAKRAEGAGLGLPFGPVVGGDVLPVPPLEAIASGSAGSIPLLAGTTAEEWRLFGLALRSVEDEATILRRLGRMVPDPHQVAATYRQEADDRSHDDMWTAILTDRIFRIPAIRLVEAQAAHRSDGCFMYQFDWATPAFEGRLGSCHALEIPFVFDNLDRGGVDSFCGPDAPQSLADAMADAWVAFARTGNPNHQGIPAWPAYDTHDRAVLHFDDPCHLEHDPSPAQRAAWDGVL